MRNPISHWIASSPSTCGIDNANCFKACMRFGLISVTQTTISATVGHIDFWLLHSLSCQHALVSFKMLCTSRERTHSSLIQSASSALDFIAIHCHSLLTPCLRILNHRSPTFWSSALDPAVSWLLKPLHAWVSRCA